jgi:hypothetical protein
MAEKSRSPAPSIKSDKLVLDFGKTILRPDQLVEKAPAKRKLPPVPGRVQAEEHVPLDEILNRGPKPADSD